MGAQAIRETADPGPGTAPPRGVLLDAFGTLLAMSPPAPLLRAELARRGIEVSAAKAEMAFRAEIAYYVEHHLEGRDDATLADLHDRCAGVVAAALGEQPIDHDVVRTAMLASLRFAAQPDAASALERLRAHGARLVVVSNWDCSLPRVLAEAGLAPLVDGVVASAVVGAAKPDPALFEAGLALAEAAPHEAVHVGDSLEHDVAGARRAGLGALLLDRRGEAVGVGSVATIRSLDALPSLLFGVR